MNSKKSPENQTVSLSTVEAKRTRMEKSKLCCMQNKWQYCTLQPHTVASRCQEVVGLRGKWITQCPSQDGRLICKTQHWQVLNWSWLLLSIVQEVQPSGMLPDPAMNEPSLLTAVHNTELHSVMSHHVIGKMWIGMGVGIARNHPEFKASLIYSWTWELPRLLLTFRSAVWQVASFT